MPAMNRVEIEGHAAADAEVSKVGAKATPLAKVRIGVSEGKDDKKKTEWVNCVVWGKRAEEATQIKKGDAVRIEGKLQTRSYDNKAGQKVYTTEVVSWSFWHRPKGQGYMPPANDFVSDDLSDMSIPF